MEPKYSAGDIAILMPNVEPRNGCLVVCKLKNEGVFFKLFYEPTFGFIPRSVQTLHYWLTGIDEPVVILDTPVKATLAIVFAEIASGGIDAKAIAMLGVLSAIGAACAQRVGRRFFHAADASQIVIDEVAGYLVTIALIPFTWKAAIIGFGLFRLFDIVKPWPASYFDDKVHNGFGVTMDDICAGVYGRLVLGLILHFWP